MGRLKNYKKISQLEKEAPNQLNGERIVRGVTKESSQSHTHIIVSRKDMSNRCSLSPGCKYKAYEIVINEKLVMRF